MASSRTYPIPTVAPPNWVAAWTLAPLTIDGKRRRWMPKRHRRLRDAELHRRVPDVQLEREAVHRLGHRPVQRVPARFLLGGHDSGGATRNCMGAWDQATDTMTLTCKEQAAPSL